MTEPPPPPHTSLAEKINFLFDWLGRKTGRTYTNSEVAAATGMSDTYVGYLRRGSADNPTLKTIQDLARFFGVKPSFFTDDADDEAIDRLDAQLDLFRAINDPNIQALALRATKANLSPAGLEAITAMIDHVQRLEAGTKNDTSIEPGSSRPPRARPARKPHKPD
ncbi:helix-turn-helix domain-containing protein [Planosporangium mesophilum]|uniref:HTH cro/C1-type domain-containing protein n=1 Tax=Planosporangium mesophilum TaxID=689768 RepID=A0A8J3TJM0_9ACTN|nr:helix-turn-helix transcriptional regulator [Planosporangium mesophilum]NJC83169.1 helix-turn-helix transcriptional regulator [Planosporangium mesophilum]GII22590.1 hypothetical protein Pme01_21870 [Planosporangium mesophilum]